MMLIVTDGTWIWVTGESATGEAGITGALSDSKAADMAAVWRRPVT
ncbi:hypothetical protein [Serratia marcescens]|nr:hypothetical protein [Serratia marcescens]WPC47767.1 hypothetical protein Q9K10_03925 [Serratia marcescens]